MDVEEIDFSVPEEDYDLDDPFLKEFFEFRLFSLRVSRCDVDRMPDRITLQCFICEPYEFLEINGNPTSRAAPAFPVTLLREWLSGERSQVTYTSTDRIRINAHGVNFDIIHNDTVVACGNLGKWKCNWKEMDIGLNTDLRTGFVVRFQPYSTFLELLSRGKPMASVPSIEVYVAGCCSGVPVAIVSTEPVVSE